MATRTRKRVARTDAEERGDAEWNEGDHPRGKDGKFTLGDALDDAEKRGLRIQGNKGHIRTAAETRAKQPPEALAMPVHTKLPAVDGDGKPVYRGGAVLHVLDARPGREHMHLFSLTKEEADSVTGSSPEKRAAEGRAAAATRRAYNNLHNERGEGFNPHDDGRTDAADPSEEKDHADAGSMICTKCGKDCAASECKCEGCSCEACKECDCASSKGRGKDPVRDSAVEPGQVRMDKRTVFRRDTFELGKPVKLPNGWLKVPVTLTRTGIFEYRNRDGSVRRELRRPEQVFDAAAIESFSLVPVTDRHPPELLDAGNTAEYQRGSIGEGLRRDGDVLRGTALITDADLVAKVESGEQRELSCGYNCDFDPTPGTYGGQHFDGEQLHIRGNHVAIVAKGRAGPEARVHMDSDSIGVLSLGSEGAASVPAPSPEEGVKTIKIGGKTYDADSPEAEAAIRAMEAKAARLDAMEAREAAKVRAELEADAKAVLGRQEKFDELDDDAIRRRVIVRLAPKTNLDGKSEAYVEARFDGLMDEFRAKKEKAKRAARADEELPDDRGDEELDASRVVTDAPDGEEDERADEGDERFDDAEQLSAERLDDADLARKDEAPHKDSVDAYFAMCRRNSRESRKPILAKDMQ